MKATCPHCGCYCPVELFLTDNDAKEAARLIDLLPGELPRLVWTYLGMFRKPKSPRAMTWARVLRVVGELDGLIRDEKMQWKGGRVLENRPAFWVQGIKVILDRDGQGKISRPLDGHNYLRAVAYELAEKGFEGELKSKELGLTTAPADGRKIVNFEDRERMGADEAARRDDEVMEANAKRGVRNARAILERLKRGPD